MEAFFKKIIIFASQSMAAQTAPQAGKPVQDAPAQTTERTTLINVQVDGTDSIGARLSTRLKERFNTSSLFRLNSEEDKDKPELRLLLNFPAAQASVRFMAFAGFSARVRVILAICLPAKSAP